MKTLLLNEQGDLEFDGSNNLRMVEGKDEIKQSIRLLLGTAQGEWFLNTEHGIDWHEILGQKQPNLMEIRAIIIEGLEQEPRIDEVEEVNVELDDRTLKVKIYMTVEGEQVEEELEEVI